MRKTELELSLARSLGTLAQRGATISTLRPAVQSDGPDYTRDD